MTTKKYEIYYQINHAPRTASTSGWPGAIPRRSLSPARPATTIAHQQSWCELFARPRASSLTSIMPVRLHSSIRLRQRPRSWRHGYSLH